MEPIDVDSYDDNVVISEIEVSQRPQRKRSAPDYYINSHAKRKNFNSRPPTPRMSSRSCSSESQISSVMSDVPSSRHRDFATGSNPVHGAVPNVRDIQKYTTKELRAALKRHGLSIKGCPLKADLQQRLQNYIQSTSTGQQQCPSDHSNALAEGHPHRRLPGTHSTPQKRTGIPPPSSENSTPLPAPMAATEQGPEEDFNHLQPRLIAEELEDDVMWLDSMFMSPQRRKQEESDELFARKLYEEECRALEKAKAIEKRDEIMAREVMRRFQEEEESQQQALLAADMEFAKQMQSQEHALQLSCRFCETVVLTPMSMANLAACCHAQECKDKGAAFCNKILPCGHPCSGVKQETSCSVCAKCASEEEKCPICWDGYAESPCVKLDCGHIMHYACLISQIESVDWKGRKIAFRALQCAAGCGSLISHPLLSSRMEKYALLYKQLGSNALQRAHQDKLCSPKKPLSTEVLLTKYSYYQCYKCDQSYCGGRADLAACREAAVADPDVKSVICPSCSSANGRSCARHGDGFLGFKCYYCCNSAVFFCWGKTHFCNDCHERSGSCQPKPCNKKTCPLQGHHPPNPSEYAMGCALCRAE